MNLKNLNSLNDPIFKDEKFEKDFKQYGYVKIENIIDSNVIDVFSEIFMLNIEKYASSHFISTIELNDIEHRKFMSNKFKELTSNIVNELLFDYDNFYGGFGVKFSTPTTTLYPHQDTTMVPYDGTRTGLTIWFSLIDTYNENGGLFVIPCSHLYNRNPRPTSTKFPYSGYEEEIMKLMIPIDLSVGDIIIMDQSLIHYSSTNNSEYIRVAVMGMLKPKEQNLVYYNYIDNNNVEEYSVHDDFYNIHQLGTKPTNSSLEKIISINYDPYIFW